MIINDPVLDNNDFGNDPNGAAYVKHTNAPMVGLDPGRGFGSDPNGEMFGPGLVPANAAMEGLGMETNFGSDPNGEMFGAPAPDKLGMIDSLKGC